LEAGVGAPPGGPDELRIGSSNAKSAYRATVAAADQGEPREDCDAAKWRSAIDQGAGPFERIMQLHGAAGYAGCSEAMIVTDGRVLAEAREITRKLGIPDPSLAGDGTRGSPDECSHARPGRTIWIDSTRTRARWPRWHRLVEEVPRL
jgi:hypothetical protein